MRLGLAFWRPWDQTGAIANARRASTDLSRCRAEREEVEMFIARHLESRSQGARVLLTT